MKLVGRMKILLHTTNKPERAIKAAIRALEFRKETNPKVGDYIGLRIDGQGYTVTFNKRSISVWETP